MNADLDALATRLYVTIDDLLTDHPEWRPERPAVGIAPQLTEAQLVTLAVIQALLGYTSERRFIRYAHTHLRPWFSFLPQRAAYNKRLRAAGNMIQHVISAIARDCPSYTDDLWLVDSTPVECGRSRETVKRSDMAGYASYGYCASRPCPRSAVISSPFPEQGGDLRVCVVDMSSTHSKSVAVQLKGLQRRGSRLAVRRRHTPDNASTTHQTPPSTTSWTP